MCSNKSTKIKSMFESYLDTYTFPMVNEYHRFYKMHNLQTKVLHDINRDA